MGPRSVNEVFPMTMMQENDCAKSPGTVIRNCTGYPLTWAVGILEWLRLGTGLPGVVPDESPIQASQG